MKQVVVIHGGDAFATYDEYLAYLRSKSVALEDLKRVGWKKNLESELGDEYEVLALSMPNRNNAKFEEWQIWFEKWLPLLNNEIILVGHSLGAVFLAKYLAEHQVTKKVLGIFLIAGPYDIDGDRALAGFTPPTSLDLLAKQGGKVFLYHSKDDVVVPFSELTKYQKALPSATARIFDDRGHFNQETFPELVADIKSL